MKFIRQLSILCIINLIAHSSTTLADNLRADINDEAFKFEYQAQSTDLGLNASILAHEDDGEIYAAGAQVQGKTLQNQSLSGALGGKLYYIDLDKSISGVAVGLGGSINLAFEDIEGLSAQLEGFYAPGVLSFNDIEHHTDISLRALYQVLSNGAVYIGYRKAHIDAVRGISGNLDTGLHIGLQLSI